MADSIFFWYLAAFFVGPFSYAKLLFWLSLIGLIGAVILTKKGIGENKWRWVAVFATEGLGLALANVTSHWRNLDSFELELLAARVSACFLAILLIVTLVVWYRFRILYRNSEV